MTEYGDYLVSDVPVTWNNKVNWLGNTLTGKNTSNLKYPTISSNYGIYVSLLDH